MPPPNLRTPPAAPAAKSEKGALKRGVARRRTAAHADAAPRTPLQRLAALALTLPVNPALPRDGAANHDHYLYGAAKQT